MAAKSPQRVRKTPASRATRVALAEPVDMPAKPVVVSSGPAVPADTVNMAAPDRFSGYERTNTGLVVVPDDDAKLIDQWYQQSAKVTDLAGLLVLFNELNSLYQHSYNSYIHAVVVMANAMGRLMDKSSQGPADDFQRQMIGFTLLRAWHGIPLDEPVKMFRFSDLLMQNMANVRTFHMIDEYQSNWLRRKAMEKIMNTPPARVHPDARRYWQTLAGGAVPPGFTAMKPTNPVAPTPEKKE